jgi:DNA-binding NarL/FixJ family response regulator
MDLVLLANDLMVVSRLQNGATQAGAHIHSAASGDRALQLCDLYSARLLIVDLATPGLELDFVQQLKARPDRETRVVAFGPHVHKNRLDAAQVAGCDLVLSRGQFFNDVETILNGEAS